MNRKQKPLQVSLRVTRPSVVQFTVGDTVQLDLLSGRLAERHGALLRPGATTLHLEQGHYYFKTLTEARLKVISGGLTASATGDDPKDPWPPPSPVPRGDELQGDAPALVVDGAPEVQP